MSVLFFFTALKTRWVCGYVHCTEYRCHFTEQHGMCVCLYCAECQGKCGNTKCEALPGVLGNRGKGYLFRGTGEQRSNFEGNRGTKTILGNMKHKKTNFRFLGNRGTSQFISGEQGNRYPPPPPREGLKCNEYQRVCE